MAQLQAQVITQDVLEVESLRQVSETQKAQAASKLHQAKLDLQAAQDHL